MLSNPVIDWVFLCKKFNNMKKNIRKKFRDEVFERDGYKCKICGDNSKIDAHHITNRNEMPKGGYIKENGITLCDKSNGCHWKAEMYPKQNFQEYSPESLYKMINSSYQIAYKKSEKL